MASIENPQLMITPDEDTKTASVKVSCRVNFTDEEMQIIQEHPERKYFKLFCLLKGHDFGKMAFWDSDDWIYSYPTIVFPDDTPEKQEIAVFETTLGYGLLNEDVVGVDEIYAKIMLTGFRPFSDSTSVRTDIVRYEFGN